MAEPPSGLPPAPSRGRAAPRRTRSAVPQAYLASQLAAICDVDLKTIHNWCERGDDTELPSLEHFRTKGGHLRFEHGAVLRFLSRWGYPIPDPLLLDRPHVVVVEPDPSARAEVVRVLGLRPPGETATPGEEATIPASPRGLWASPRMYAHLWDDPFAALIAVGERSGAGAPPDVAVISVPTHGIDPAAWVAAARHHVGEALRVVLLTEGGRRAAPEAELPGVVAVVGRSELPALRSLLGTHGSLLRGRPAEGGRAQGMASTRRVPMAPREPIFVASQVASIWGVDLKTVHAWVDRGEIEAFRTPGRHLRFRRRSLLHFLRRYTMEIPPSLGPARPRVMVIDPSAVSAATLAASLARRSEVIVRNDPVASLAEIGVCSAGASMLDAIVAVMPVAGVDAARWISALTTHPDTRYSRLVVVGGTAEAQRHWQSLGVLATVDPGDIDVLGSLLDKALGVG